MRPLTLETLFLEVEARIIYAESSYYASERWALREGEVELAAGVSASKLGLLSQACYHFSCARIFGLMAMAEELKLRGLPAP